MNIKERPQAQYQGLVVATIPSAEKDVRLVDCGEENCQKADRLMRRSWSKLVENIVANSACSIQWVCGCVGCGLIDAHGIGCARQYSREHY